MMINRIGENDKPIKEPLYVEIPRDDRSEVRTEDGTDTVLDSGGVRFKKAIIHATKRGLTVCAGKHAYRLRLIPDSSTWRCKRAGR